jgi:hypothetical protein
MLQHACQAAGSCIAGETWSSVHFSRHSSKRKVQCLRWLGCDYVCMCVLHCRWTDKLTGLLRTARFYLHAR